MWKWVRCVVDEGGGMKGGIGGRAGMQRVKEATIATLIYHM